MTQTALIRHKRGDALLCAADVDTDLTGYTIRMQVRVPGADTLLADLSLGAGIDIVSTSPTQSRYTLRIDGATTAAWPLGLAQFDILYTAAGLPGRTDTWLLTVIDGVTR